LKNEIGKENNRDSSFDNNIKKYSVRHVFDIKKNINLQYFKKAKELFCPRCISPCLYSKTNNYFIKCLNCDYKVCKYCLKEYTNHHLDAKSVGYCKVYFRRDEDEFYIGKKNFFHLFFLQLVFVLGMFILTCSGTYLVFYNIFKKCFKLNDKRKNFSYSIKKFFVITFSIIFLIISSTFIIACFPFFPIIIALFDY
jgi:hypothetical protein